MIVLFIVISKENWHNWDKKNESLCHQSGTWDTVYLHTLKAPDLPIYLDVH